jgi:signal transduction histidine kinase
MKLFSRYTRINLVATVIVFLLSAIAFYFLLRFIVLNQVDEDLKIEQREIETYTNKYTRLPEIITVRDQYITYTKTEKAGGKRIFYSLLMKEATDKEAEVFRQLLFYINVRGQWYQITVSKSLEGTDNLIESIVTIAIITILVILIISLVINRLLLQKLWQPFYETLSVIRSFQLGKNRRLIFPATNIEEFTIMNETLSLTTAKAYEDYQYLKEFTENASHELQTPLAIIRSKMDVLIQHENLSELQSKTVQGVYEAIERLSRLNQGLLLLTKIENGQYQDKTGIRIGAKVKEKIQQFEEMIASKNIKLNLALNDTVDLYINASLLDILLNNLFSNAVKYNIQNGMLEIITGNGVFEISNSAAFTALDDSKLFRRFAKSGYTGEGIGLGLAIVHQATEASGFSIRYNYDNQLHHFILTDNEHYPQPKQL